jgi:hypothetical protein
VKDVVSTISPDTMQEVIDSIAISVNSFFAEGVSKRTLVLEALRQKELTASPNFYIWEWSDWMDEHYEIPFYVMLTYVIFVYFGRKFMENRKALNLQYPLAFWNFLLAGIFNYHNLHLTFINFVSI